jgi:hypothetical protein
MSQPLFVSSIASDERMCRRLHSNDTLAAKVHDHCSARFSNASAQVPLALSFNATFTAPNHRQKMTSVAGGTDTNVPGVETPHSREGGESVLIFRGDDDWLRGSSSPVFKIFIRASWRA